MRIPRRWWSSGLYIWIDLYRQRQLYRQFVETAREVKRLRKVRDEARRWERLGWTYGDHKAMQQQAMAAYMQANQSPYGPSGLANAAHTQNPYRRGLLNSADRSLHDYVSCLGNLIG